MKIFGIILLIIGFIGCIIYGIQAVGDSESFTIFGVDVAVSKANWTPLIISAVILIVGVFLSRSGKTA